MPCANVRCALPSGARHFRRGTLGEGISRAKRGEQGSASGCAETGIGAGGRLHPNIPASLSRCASPCFCEHSTAECSRTLCVSRADGRLGRLPRLPRPPRPDSLTKHAPAIFLAQRTSNFGAVRALNSVHALLWNPLHCKMLLLRFEGFASYRWAVVAAAPTVEPNDERPSRWLRRHASQPCRAVPLFSGSLHEAHPHR